MNTAPVVLIIRDGWGENPHATHDPFNAVKLAHTPVDMRLREDWPTTLIRTCGEDVGLPPGTMGNSEVGHQNIGAGRIVNQAIMRINTAIRDGSFFGNEVLNAAFDHAQSTGGAVHLIGLVSDGQVHADLAHLLALIDLAGRVRFPESRLFVHAFTDGRDTNPFSARRTLDRVALHLETVGVGRVASVIGRYYAMDRDHRWSRTARAYRCLVGEGSDATALTADAACERYYEEPDEPSRRGDEFIIPTRITAGGPRSRIGDGDAVIFLNFRGDRPRQITRAFTLDDDAWSHVKKGGFDRGRRIENLFFATLTSFEEGLPVRVAFGRPPRMPDIFGDVLAQHGLEQFRCAETEKFPHITFFFNDYREEPFAGEHRELIPSPTDVTTYDQKPEMSAPGVCAAVCARLAASDVERCLVVNLANADMVGHTGNLAATTRAVETVDQAVGAIVDAALAVGGTVLVTADHGNAEQMWDPGADCPHTAHTVYDVPLIVAGPGATDRVLRAEGRLADLAPTLLDLLGLPTPAAMTGRSLLA